MWKKCRDSKVLSTTHVKYSQTFHSDNICVPFLAIGLQLCGLHWTPRGLASTTIAMEKACNCYQLAAVTAINLIC
jgi:hypothetical protein